MSFCLEREGGACTICVRFYRILPSPEAPSARIVPDTIAFGLKRGVGLDTMSEFFARLRLDTQVGCSPSALRGVMQALETALLETAGRWEKDGVRAGEVREIIGAVDETFLQQMMLVFQDVPTGYIVQEAVADDRSYATWKAVVDARLTALGTGVLYLVSDRVKAFQRASSAVEGRNGSLSQMHHNHRGLPKQRYK